MLFVSMFVESHLADIHTDPGADGTTAYDALEKGFDDLMDLCDAVADKFTAERDAHAAKKP